MAVKVTGIPAAPLKDAPRNTNYGTFIGWYDGVELYDGITELVTITGVGAAATGVATAAATGVALHLAVGGSSAGVATATATALSTATTVGANATGVATATATALSTATTVGANATGVATATATALSTATTVGADANGVATPIAVGAAIAAAVGASAATAATNVTAPSVTTDASSYMAGQPVLVTWTGLSQATDRIVIVPDGATYGAIGDWVYSNGTQTLPVGVTAAGSHEFTAGSTGDYRARLLRQDP